MRFNVGPIRLTVRVAFILALAVMLSGCLFPLAQDNPETRPWWCDSTGGEGTHGSEYYINQGIQKGSLSWEDCQELSGYLYDVIDFATQWPTRGEAEAAGWVVRVEYEAGMGTHHSLGSPLEGSFDPSRPTYLQYDGNGPDAKLVGVSWFVNNGPDAPPAGFPGDNDWWHSHEYLCFSNATGLVIRNGQCQPGDNGTSVYLGDYWMVHAWVIPGWHHPPDVFIGHHPCLLPDGPAAPDDPCWNMDGGHMG